MSDFRDNPAPARAHLPALDGLRALAIGLVLCVHFTLYLGMGETTLLDRAAHRLFLAGFCGVDLFFALSGFLITAILLDARRSPRPLANFYARRLLRIVPPYYLFLAFYFGIATRLVPLPPGLPAPTSQAWYWGYLANIDVALSGWRDPALSHFWSLAVEEQFYLLWPFAALFLSTKRLRELCFALILLAPVLRVLCWQRGLPEAAYVLTPCRMDALALGALVALLLREPLEPARLLARARLAGLLSALGIAAIAISAGRFSHFDPLVYTLGLSLTAIAGAALVAFAALAPPGHLLIRALSLRPLREVGKVSYSMYILHVPILCLMVALGLDLRKVKPWHGTLVPWLLLELALGGGAIFLSALAAWHLYEKRLLALKRYFPARGPSA